MARTKGAKANTANKPAAKHARVDEPKWIDNFPRRLFIDTTTLNLVSVAVMPDGILTLLDERAPSKRLYDALVDAGPLNEDAKGEG